MDIATIVTIITLGIMVIIFVLLKWVRFFGSRKLGSLAIVTVAASLITDILGGIFPGWDTNSACYKYLGCNTGFFGYDIVEYFLFGLAAVTIIFWLGKKFPRISLHAEKKWQTILVTVSFVAALIYFWELLKALYDFLRSSLFHVTLFSWRFHINLLAQPSNLNTMGNLFFGLIGIAFAFCVIWFVDAHEM